MEVVNKINQAEVAAKEALDKVFDCILKEKNFILEAGAGAGKTYSLVHALRFLIKNCGKEMLRHRQKVACITYTNVASNEIASRTDRHPIIYSSTIHAFSWLLIKDFQSELQRVVPTIAGWEDRMKEKEVADFKGKRIIYDLGYPKIKEKEIWLGHNDVLKVLVEFLKHPKFRSLLTDRFPIIFIDEYQDTDENVVEALKSHFLDTNSGPLLGFFGDHWQKIYGNGCGKIDHPNLVKIDKKANFRSAKTIVDSLNTMRPSLPQEVSEACNIGEVSVYHTNGWEGVRQKGAHWSGDLPSEEAHKYLEKLKAQLINSGWDFSPGVSKILMLTHKVLASEQGYRDIADHFSNTDQYIKKEDPYVAFFLDVLEPVCQAYEARRFGEMFAVLDSRSQKIQSHADKQKWAEDMAKLFVLRSGETIGAVLGHLKSTRHPRLSQKIEENEHEIEKGLQNPTEEMLEEIALNTRLKKIPYRQMIALSIYVNEYSPFSTKHGVKGAEFENVLVVVGRGWSKYNFGKMLEAALREIPEDQRNNFEENRNLFYVACSRPKQRLCILFTQELSAEALKTLGTWFGSERIKSIV